MALSTSTPTTWDRTLPIPTGLQSRERLDLAHPNSTLLPHRTSSDQFLAPDATDPKRRSIAAYPTLGPKCAQNRALAEDDRSTHRSASVMSGESLSTSSSDGLNAQERSDGICLCPSESRIPRPRNAFILYRQHQHAAVVAQFPKLPNPDISKIIGEQWRCLPSKEKDQWKALAEQEKARHAQQFPDYRYRPRRTSKFLPQDSQASTQSQESHCGRCGGKLLKPPHTSHYPTFEHSNMIPVVGIPRPQKRGYSEAFVQQPRPSIVQVAPGSYTAPIRYGFGSGMAPRHDSVHYPVPPPPPRPLNMVDDGPDAKRRRMDVTHVSQPLHTAAQYSDHRERGLYHPGQVLRPPMTTPVAPSMAPPSMRPNHTGPNFQTSPRGPMLIHQRRDPSLVLPPLKTSSTQPKPTTAAEAQMLKSSLEATIMSYPVLTKLKTLSLITPSRSPSTSCGSIIAIEGLDPSRVFDMTNSLYEQLGKEGTFDVRIFAGPNPYQAFPTHVQTDTEDKRADGMTPLKYLNLMQEWHKISQDLTKFINKQPHSKSVVESDDSRMQGLESHAPRDQDEATDPFCQQPEKSKHSPISAISPKTIEKTADMTIQSARPADSSPKDNTDHGQPTTPSWSARLTRARVPAWKQDTQQRQDGLRYQDLNQANSAVVSENAAIPPLSQTPVTPPRPVTSPISPKTGVSKYQQPQSAKIPIALVPHYQLTTVDACSIAFPVTDSYDVLTHWRWHATIWRGCIGPDISVVVKSTPEQQDEETTAAGPADLKRSSNPSGGETSGRSNSISAASQTQPQARDAPSVEPKESRAPLPPFSVEVRLKDYRAVIVQAAKKSENNSDADREKENELWEKAKRRVGFEVEETLRK